MGGEKVAIVAALLSLPFCSHAAFMRVPQDHPTLQAAIDSAQEGDEIILSSGRHCGAFLDKRLTIKGEGQDVTLGPWETLRGFLNDKPLAAGGRAVIIGCPHPAPVHPLGVRNGIWISSPKASGSVIKNLVFDGAGVSNSNTEPLAGAIFQRCLPARDTSDFSLINQKVNDMTIEHNTILGTMQAITNNGGDRWNIHHNHIQNISAFDCATGAQLCAGGIGIIARMNPGEVPLGESRSRPANNIISHNKITGIIPDTLKAFSYGGIVLVNADRSTVEHNSIAIPDNPRTPAAGIAVSLIHFELGLPGSQNNTIINNDARDSEIALLVDSQDFSGLTLRGHLGLNLIGDEAKTIKNRGIKTLDEFGPLDLSQASVPQDGQNPHSSASPKLSAQDMERMKAALLSLPIREETKERLLKSLDSLALGSHLPAPAKPFSLSVPATETFALLAQILTVDRSVALGNFSQGIKEPSSETLLTFDAAPGAIVDQFSLELPIPGGFNREQCFLKRLPSGALWQRHEFTIDRGEINLYLQGINDTYVVNIASVIRCTPELESGFGAPLAMPGNYEQWMLYPGPGDPALALAFISFPLKPAPPEEQVVFFHHDILAAQKLHMADITVGQPVPTMLEITLNPAELLPETQTQVMVLAKENNNPKQGLKVNLSAQAVAVSGGQSMAIISALDPRAPFLAPPAAPILTDNACLTTGPQPSEALRLSLHRLQTLNLFPGV